MATMTTTAAIEGRVRARRDAVRPVERRADHAGHGEGKTNLVEDLCVRGHDTPHSFVAAMRDIEIMTVERMHRSGRLP